MAIVAMAEKTASEDYVPPHLGSFEGMLIFVTARAVRLTEATVST